MWIEEINIHSRQKGYEGDLIGFCQGRGYVLGMHFFAREKKTLVILPPPMGMCLIYTWISDLDK